jgi:hypothetical protein
MMARQRTKTLGARHREGGKPVAPYEAVSFSAGQKSGARVAACVARLAALELMEHSSWWNRRRRGLMARALIAHAEEMEDAAEADSPEHVPALPSELRRAGHAPH